MVEQSHLQESKAIHRRTGRTFYYATRFLPERVRHETYVLYAFFRVADEVVDDDNGLTPEEQRAELRRIRDAALGRRETDDPVLAAFSEVREREGIDDAEVESFVDAMMTDAEKSRYETFDSLREYMRGSAAAVGHMMTTIMDPDRPEAARPHAGALGEAFQLTNFLRDVGEDIVERNRIYVPQETLRDHGVSDADIENLRVTDGFRAAIRAELRRAETLYHEGVAGIKYLPEDCQFPVLLASVLYADHHRLIRERNYDTLSATPGLSATRKVWLVAKTRWHWAWNRDPEAVFAAVSAIRSGSTEHRGPDHPEPLPH